MKTRFLTIHAYLRPFLSPIWWVNLYKPRILIPISLSDKVTLESLKSHLWAAAGILRGSLDASEYREPVMTILFLKRLNDRFEENVEKLIAEGKTEKEANQDFRHDFFVPKNARWNKLSTIRSRVGEKIDEICRSIEKSNEKLEGVLTNTKYSDQEVL